jgi:hypothetical protein
VLVACLGGGGGVKSSRRECRHAVQAERMLAGVSKGVVQAIQVGRVRQRRTHALLQAASAAARSSFGGKLWKVEQSRERKWAGSTQVARGGQRT